MIKHKLFLRWWLAFISILVGLTVFITDGGLTDLWEKDATKLSFVIIAMFLGGISAGGLTLLQRLFKQ